MVFDKATVYLAGQCMHYFTNVQQRIFIQKYFYFLGHPSKSSKTLINFVTFLCAHQNF